MTSNKRYLMLFSIILIHTNIIRPQESHDEQVGVFFHAIESQNLQTAENMLRHNPNLVHSTKECYGTPLHVAVMLAQSTVIRFLIAHGALISSSHFPAEETPLHLACRIGKPEIVKLLIELGADIEAETVNKETPLHYATKYTHTECVRILLQHGADTEAQERWHNLTPLSCIPYIKPDSYHLALLLICYGAGINKENKQKLDRLFPQWRTEKKAFEDGQEDALMACIPALPEALAHEIIRYAYPELIPDNDILVSSNNRTVPAS